MSIVGTYQYPTMESVIYGKPAAEAVHNSCFPCHEIVKARDFVFNRYAP